MVELYLLSFPLTPITLIKDWLNGQQSSSNSFGYRIISPFSFFVSVLVFLTAFFKNWSPFSHSLLQFGTAASWTWFPVGHTFPVWVVFISWFSPLFWISSSHKFIKRVHEWQDFQTFCVWKYLLNLHTWLTSMCVSHSVVSDSLQPHGLQLTRPLCPWNSPGKNTRVGCHSLLQGIFPTQGMKLGLLHCLSHWRSPVTDFWDRYKNTR